jgi:hypothetical protein
MLATQRAASILGLLLLVLPLAAEETLPAREKRKLSDPEIVKAAEVKTPKAQLTTQSL